MYVATLDPNFNSPDHLTRFFSQNSFVVGAYLVFLAMVFDALDGRLARFTRHTTDFGGQLDSLADVLSFGAAPAFLALEVFKHDMPGVPTAVSRLIWAIGALYMSCAAMRLARFNVSNEHGEQHHFSFLGLPSPGAGGAVAAFVLMHEELKRDGFLRIASVTIWILPLVVLATGLLMVSAVRYPHIINRYLRGKRSVDRVLIVLALLLLFIVWHQYTLAIGTLVYALYGPVNFLLAKMRPKPPAAPANLSL
jgi:CDP-diacylglycerol--serine O-phosphatidyltransferase